MKLITNNHFADLFDFIVVSFSVISSPFLLPLFAITFAINFPFPNISVPLTPFETREGIERKSRAKAVRSDSEIGCRVPVVTVKPKVYLSDLVPIVP